MHYCEQSLLEALLLDHFHTDDPPSQWMKSVEMLYALGIERESPGFTATKLGKIISPRSLFQKKRQSDGMRYHCRESQESIIDLALINGGCMYLGGF